MLMFSRVTLIWKLHSTLHLDHLHAHDLPCSRVKSSDDLISDCQVDSAVPCFFIYIYIYRWNWLLHFHIGCPAEPVHPQLSSFTYFGTELRGQVSLVFTGQVLFLWPGNQCQNAEGNAISENHPLALFFFNTGFLRETALPVLLFDVSRLVSYLHPACIAMHSRCCLWFLVFDCQFQSVLCLSWTFSHVLEIISADAVCSPPNIGSHWMK